MQLGVDIVLVLVGPVSYLLLSKPAKGVEKNFSLRSLLEKILPIYKWDFLNLPSMSFIPDLNDLNFLIHYCIDEYFFREVISELKAAGASWIQFDEPTIVLDLDSHKLKAFTDAYSEL